MRRLLPIYAAAAIMAATIAPLAQAQDDLDSVAKGLSSPTPTPAPTAAPRTATATPTSRAAAATPTSRPSATAKQPANVRADLAHGHFIGLGDLTPLANKPVPVNTFLTGVLKYIGHDEGGRRRFQSVEMSSFFTAAPPPALVFIRFPGKQDPKIFQNGYRTKWEAAAPLRVERVTDGPTGLAVYATDITAP